MIIPDIISQVNGQVITLNTTISDPVSSFHLPCVFSLILEYYFLCFLICSLSSLHLNWWFPFWFFAFSLYYFLFFLSTYFLIFPCSPSASFPIPYYTVTYVLFFLCFSIFSFSSLCLSQRPKHILKCLLMKSVFPFINFESRQVECFIVLFKLQRKRGEISLYNQIK